MAFEKKRQDTWYNGAALGDDIFKVVWRGHPHSAKVVTRNGLQAQISSQAAQALLEPTPPTLATASTPLDTCDATTRAGFLCARPLPCRYHS